MSRYTRRWFKYHTNRVLHRRSIRLAREAALRSAAEDELWASSLDGGRLVPRTINDVAITAAKRPLRSDELEALGYVRKDNGTDTSAPTEWWWER